MKKVLIYCANGYAERVKYLLDPFKFEVIGYIDSNPEKWGLNIYSGG